jgi:hypothetical protein
MAVTPKSIADGQLPASKGTLYTVPASTAALITITLSATGGSARTVNIYVKRSGSSSRLITPKDLTLNPGDAAYIDHAGRPYALSAGDEVEGDASAATEIDYLIDGMEIAV